MADGAGTGRDEPARSPSDHAPLLSELDSHDLAVATDPETPSDADRDVVAAYRVSDGSVELEDVAARYR